jgi:hypothetical protein
MAAPQELDPALRMTPSEALDHPFLRRAPREGEDAARAASGGAAGGAGGASGGESFGLGEGLSARRLFSTHRPTGGRASA